MQRLKDKVAIVTGGAQGIGRQYSLRFAREGAAVAVLDLREEQARAVEGEIARGGGKAMTVAADVTSEQQMAHAAKAVADRFGRIDILMNNAALYYDLDLTDQSIAYTKKVMEVNVYGVIIAARAVFPYMKRQRSGSIINISSIGAYPVGPRGADGPDFDTLPVSGYALSKSGVVFLTKTWAKAAGKYNIRVNAIAPGVTLTEATMRVTKGRAATPDDWLVKSSALNRPLDPEDLTGAATFLASDDSKQVTGQTIVVDAGNVMLG